MSVKEKRLALDKFCEEWGLCSTGKPRPCPLYSMCDDCSEFESLDDDVIDEYYQILVDNCYISPLNETDTEDIINHPNHYTNGGMECIDEMLLVFGRGVVADFCLCNAWKYRYRALHKNGQEDIDKSHWYMSKYKEIVTEIRELEGNYNDDIPF